MKRIANYICYQIFMFVGGMQLKFVDFYEAVAYKCRMIVNKRTTRWIARELRKNGIEVMYATTYAALSGFCAVGATVSLEQIGRYQDIYRRALKRFPKLLPINICSLAKPLEHLNKEWADSCGILEYAAPVITVPCNHCGKRDFRCYRWGNIEEHTYSCVTSFPHIEMTIDGYLCDECTQKVFLKYPMQE